MAKTCRKCGKSKSAAEFRPNARMRDGLSSWCSACHVEATRRWREERERLAEEAARPRLERERLEHLAALREQAETAQRVRAPGSSGDSS